MKKLLMITLLLLFLLPVTARAADDTLQSEYDTLQIGDLKGALSGDASRILGDTDLLDGLDFTKGFNRIISAVASKLGAIVRRASPRRCTKAFLPARRRVTYL